MAATVARRTLSAVSLSLCLSLTHTHNVCQAALAQDEAALVELAAEKAALEEELRAEREQLEAESGAAAQEATADAAAAAAEAEATAAAADTTGDSPGDAVRLTRPYAKPPCRLRTRPVTRLLRLQLWLSQRRAFCTHAHTTCIR